MAAAEIRRTILLLAGGGFVSGLSIRLAEPLLPKVAHDFGVSVAAASVLITGFTLAYGLFQLVHGPLGDRIGKLRAVVGAMVLAAMTSAACAYAPSLEWLAAFRFLTGMTAGAVIPLSFAFIGDNVPYERRQTVLAQFITGTLMGQTLGPLIGGMLSDSIGWRATFLIPACGFLAIGVLIGRDARNVVQKLHPDVSFNPVTRLVGLLKRRRARMVLGAVAIEGFLFFGAFAYLGAYLRHQFDLSYTVIGFTLAGFGLGGIAYSMLVRTLVRRLGQPVMVAGGGIVLLACFVVIALTPAWGVIVPCIFFLGLGYYMLHNTLQTHATEMAPEARGSAVAFFAFAFFLGQAAGVSALGLAAERAGYAPVFAGAGVGLALLGAWFGRTLRRL
jgi:MFS transporter, YNFM family, putative membrane transport protein